MKLTVVGVLVASVIAALAVKNQPPAITEPASPKPSQAIQVDGRTKQLPRLLEIGADKCIPCKAMQPILADFRKEYEGKLTVDFIDVWENPSAGDVYRIQSIPTQVFFDAEGKEVFRHVGFYGKEDMVAKMKELGFKL